MSSDAIKVFYSYCRKDELLRAELAKHLSPLRHEGIILDWYDRDINGGEDWDGRIKKALNEADVILLLVSADFLASEYCYGNEIAVALERHKNGESMVIPILLRPVDWGSTPFAHIKPLPHNRKPITAWKDQDEAFASVAQDVRAKVKAIYQRNHGSPSLMQRLKQTLRPAKEPKAKANAVPEVTGYLRVRIECPTCGQEYYTTFVYAESQFRCRACGCIESVPNVFQLLIRAIQQEKIPRETQEQVFKRKVAKQDLTLTSGLLQKETRKPNDSVKELAAHDIVKEFKPQDENDENNDLIVALHAGIIPQLEKALEDALRPGVEYGVDEPIKSESVTAENLTVLAEVAADTLFKMALGEQEENEESNPTAVVEQQASVPASDQPGPFQSSSVLCLYCQSDRAFGEQLTMHMAALEQDDGPVNRIDTVVVDAPEVAIGTSDELVNPFHIVVLLVSPGMLTTEFCQSGKVSHLLECHQHRDIVLIPVIVQPMAWQKMAFSKLQVLPAGGKPLSSWSPVDEGCANVVDAIRGVIAKLSVEIIVKVGERGDEVAKNTLWVCYAMGWGVKKNPEKMIHWLVQAAEVSNNPGTWFMAGMTLEKRNPSSALVWMQKSVDAGHGPAMSWLGGWYENGVCVPQDLKKGFEWRVKAAEAGHGQGMFQLARMYLEGIGASKDDVKGTAWLERAAEKGEAMAMVHIGNSYYLGRGVAMDKAKADEWWKKAAASGNEEAIQTLQNQGYQG